RSPLRGRLRRGVDDPGAEGPARAARDHLHRLTARDFPRGNPMAGVVVTRRRRLLHANVRDCAVRIPVRWQSSAVNGTSTMHRHKPNTSCLYCKAVQYVSIGDPPPIKSWKRPLLFVAGVALTTCTVMAIRFAWERTGAEFFAGISALV